MADARYLFRLDDACPWMDHDRWTRLENLFDQYAVKPVVAVVPRCEDEALKVGAEDPDFWQRVLAWQGKGWTLGLHGYNHVFAGRGRGLVPLNDYTEFAGRPEAEQRQKIRDGWSELRSHGLEVSVWVAPAHTFDRTTLRCLLEETSIRTVSDGLSNRPFRRYGFAWLPQQLWRPRRCPDGLWTICLHPNEMDDEAFSGIESFLVENQNRVTMADLTVRRPWGVSDWLFSRAFLFLRAIKQRTKRPL